MKERERKQNCELSNQCEAQAGVFTEHPIHAFSNGFLSSREMVSLSRRLCSNFSFIKVASGNKKNDGKILSIDAHRVTLGIEGQPFHLELHKCSWASPPRRCFRGRKAWGNLPCFLFESKMTETLLSRWTNKRLVKDPDCNKWRIVSSAVSPSEIRFLGLLQMAVQCWQWTFLYCVFVCGQPNKALGEKKLGRACRS